MMEEPDVIQGPRRSTWASRWASLVILSVDARVGHVDPYAAALAKSDHQVLSATSDPAALELLETHAVDMVLLDDHAGLALLEEIHARGHHDVVIIVLAERPSMFVAREAMRLGAYAYISRPCDPKLLQVMLDDACMRRAHQEYR
jgi:DNA-binding NtrC family response regulator